MSETATSTWLTQEAFDRLKGELDELVANRPVIAAEINARREEGDLKENGGYHAARDEQGKQEVRIRQLQELLNNAQVGIRPTSNSGVVEPGMVVTVAYDEDDQETFLLASREEGSHGSMSVYSPQSPIGAAILGAAPGESREYELPNGKMQQVTVIEAKPFTG